MSEGGFTGAYGACPAPPGTVYLRATRPLRGLRALRFTLHAAAVAGGQDPVGREVLVSYALRPPLAQERMSRVGDDLLRIALKRPFSVGTVAVDLDPRSLLCRLVPTVPPSRFHGSRGSGLALRSGVGEDCGPLRRGAGVGEPPALADRAQARDRPRLAASPTGGLPLGLAPLGRADAAGLPSRSRALPARRSPDEAPCPRHRARPQAPLPSPPRREH